MRPIDKDALMAELKHRLIKCHWADGRVEMFKSIPTEALFEFIENFPTIDLVKRAKWVQPDNSPIGCLVCSNCLTYPISKNGRWVLSKYCPDCGAKMEE